MKAPSFLRKLFGRARLFGPAEHGMTLPLLAISLVAITGMVGIAIDTARAQLVQSKLQFSLDAAGLAAGSTVSTSNLNTEVTKYLSTNFNGYLGATLTGSNATVDSTNTIITLTASASLPTTFMGVVGVNVIMVNAHSTISRAVTGLELVMVLDNTGSMSDSAGGSVSKIQALQTASTTLVNQLFASNPPAGKLWVGIVPFSQAVNIGTSHTTWMNSTYDTALSTAIPTAVSGSSATVSAGPGWGNTSWNGCVDARQNGEDVNDDPPSQSTTSTLFQQYYWPSDNLTYGSPYNNTPNSSYDNWALPVYNKCVTTYRHCKSGVCTNVSPTCSTSGGFTCTLTTPTCTSTSSCTVNSTTSCNVTSYTYASPIDTLHNGPNLLCPQQVTPMTNNTGTLISAINSMVAEGDTVINQGVQWGWNMLSPRWQGLWGGTMNANGLPLAYGTQGMAKAVILMTDGFNTIDNLAHGSYWFLENGRTGSTNSTTAVNNMNTKTSTLCTAMKAQGIYIYTIALGTDVNSTSIALLQGCATAPNYFFNSPSTSQLQGIFNQIGDSLSNLRVSQ